MRVWFPVFFVLMAILSVDFGAHASDFPSSVPDELAAIQALRFDPDLRTVNSTFRTLRPQAMREAAMTLSLQAAVKWRYDQILTELENRAVSLDQIFNFSPLLFGSGKVLPPVIAESKNAFRVESNDLSLSTERQFKIISDARFVTTPPSWRDYLIQRFNAEDQVDPALLPQDEDEVAQWLQVSNQGWEMGLKQAERVFAANLARLKRDYLGVLTFKMLVTQKIVTMPLIAEGRLGIQVQDRMLGIDERVFRITMPARFTKPEGWSAAGGYEQ